MSETSWLAPKPPDVVWFSGSDAVRFLNDIISREIGDLEDGESRRSFLLEPQGKLRFLLWVIRDGDRIGLVTDAGRGDDLATALGRYRIRVDVDIEPESEDVWLVVGPGEGWDVSWSGAERHLVIGDRPDLPTGSEGDYEALRVANGEPAWDVDVDEDTIPHVSGLVPLSVDFDKGCFLGQELVARIDSRGGNVPRHLRLIDAGEVSLTKGAPVMAEGEDVGSISSAAGGIGLATLSRKVAVGDTVTVGGVDAVVKDLPVQARD